MIISSAKRMWRPVKSAGSLSSSAAFFCSIACVNSDKILDAKSGFAINLSTPAEIASSITSSQWCAVKIITADSWPIIFLICRVTSIPSCTGIFKSISKISYASRRADFNLTISSASLPFIAKSEEIPTSCKTSCACSQAIGSSSIIKTFNSAGLIETSCLVSEVFSELRKVKVTVNSEPTPFSDLTEIVPFIISTIFLVIVIPSPVPPYSLDAVIFSWLNTSKICGR